MMMQFIRPVFIFCLLFAASSVLSACGKKGPLYIPVQTAPATDTTTDKKNKTDKTANPGNPDNPDNNTDKTEQPDNSSE